MAFYGNSQTWSTAFTAYDGIPFTIMADSRTGVYPSWELPMVRVERHVPHSNRTYRQNMGPELASITLDIEFEGLDDYRRFHIAEKTDRKARLTLLSSFNVLRGIPHTIHRDYEHFDYVVIDRIVDNGIEIGETPSCTATFKVAYDEKTMKVVP